MIAYDPAEQAAADERFGLRISASFACEVALRRFVREAWPIIEPATPYLHNWHVDCICDHLEAITRGEITRLIVNLPPRYMKSTLITILWPCWEWLHNPGERWIFCSYKEGLSKEHSLRRRDVVKSDWYQGNWGDRVRIEGERDVQLEMDNSRRGKFLACSVRAAPHGKGGNRIVLDDIQDPLEANSETAQQHSLWFYRNALYPRLNDKTRGAVVNVQQRLAEDDMTGQFLKEGGWVHLKLPARAPRLTVVKTPRGVRYRRDAGSALWPARDDERALEKIEREMTPGPFAGQFQQEPVPPGGLLFQRDWFRIIGHGIPPGRTVRYWDKAATEGGGAYSAGVKMRRGDDGQFYILDVIRGQWGYVQREKVISQTAALDGPECEVWVEKEPGGAGIESAQNTVLANPGYLVYVDDITRSGDKVLRAGPLASMASNGHVFLLAGAWNHDFLNEMEHFPKGTYKDQVDAASGAFNKLALVPEPGDPATGGEAPPAPDLYLPGMDRSLFHANGATLGRRQAA